MFNKIFRWIFSKIKEIGQFKNFEIIIFSDHDSRIKDDDNLKNSVIFFHKKKNSKTSLIKINDISINNLIHNLSSDPTIKLN